jgi:hypothetical protein
MLNMSLIGGTMSYQLSLTRPTNELLLPRIGGEALIGGIIDWPNNSNSEPLTLVASVPNTFITRHTGIKLRQDLYTSTFSYYSETEYFLDQITYHGNPDELSCINHGTTRVVQHPLGKNIHAGPIIPPHLIEIGEFTVDNEDCGSRIGGNPCLLQNESLDTHDMKFAIQFRSADFPKIFNDIFGILDALGYLFLKENSQLSAEDGLFFVQTT